MLLQSLPRSVRQCVSSPRRRPSWLGLWRGRGDQRLVGPALRAMQALLVHFGPKRIHADAGIRGIIDQVSPLILAAAEGDGFEDFVGKIVVQPRIPPSSP